MIVSVFLRCALLLLFAIFVKLLHTYAYRSMLKVNVDAKNVLKLVKNTANEANIPKIIHQTYHSMPPQKVFDNIRKYAPQYKHIVYNDKDSLSFLQTHFVSDVASCFEDLVEGAHKADLFRYAVLYVEGGVYLDIKTELVMDISNLFPDNHITTVKSTKFQEIYQGVIAAPPRQSIFLDLIHAIVKSSRHPVYNRFCLDFYTYIKMDCLNLKSNTNVHVGKMFRYKLFEEQCSATDASQCHDGFDRYGFCCNIVDSFSKKIIIKTRYSDYPSGWKL